MKTALKIIAVVALIMASRPAMANPGPSNGIVNFDVTNPDVTVTAILPGPGGESTAEFTLLGTGRAIGSFETYTNDQTGWAFLSGKYLGSAGDFSSTFQAKALRTGESTSSTFTTAQGVNATGVSLLDVYGEAGVCSVADTWVLGIGQTFEVTGGSVTITAENSFEQRDNGGSVVGNPVNNQFATTAAGGNSFTGLGEGGSYDGTTFGVQPQPGFGVAASMLSLNVHDSSSSTSISTDVTMLTDHIVGETATWYEYPGYSGP